MQSTWAISPTYQPTGGSTSVWPLGLVLVCIWLIALLTITPLERDAVEGVSTLDGIAVAKLVARFAALGILTLVILWSGSDVYGGRKLWLLAPFGLYLAWALASTAWSPLTAVSVGQFTSLLVLCLLAWSIAAWDEGEETARRVLAHTTLALWVFSLGMLAVFTAFGGGADRFDFALAHPTAIGGTASLGLLLLLASLVIWRWSWARWLLIPGLLVHGSVLLIAHNRTALGVFMLVAVLAVATYADRILLTVAALIGSLTVVVAAAVEPGWFWLFGAFQDTAEFLSREQHAFDLSAFSGRDELWQVMWESYRQSPWIGHGYFVSSRDGILDIWDRSANFNAHNMFLQALVSTGAVGAALFTWGLWRPTGYALRQLASDTEARRRAGLFVLVGSWLLLWGMLDVAVLGPVTPYNVAFFVVLGLLGGSAPARRAGPSADDPPEIPRVAVHP